jgi:hypothetical protein
MGGCDVSREHKRPMLAFVIVAVTCGLLLMHAARSSAVGLFHGPVPAWSTVDSWRVVPGVEELALVGPGGAVVPRSGDEVRVVASTLVNHTLPAVKASTPRVGKARRVAAGTRSPAIGLAAVASAASGHEHASPTSGIAQELVDGARADGAGEDEAAAGEAGAEGPGARDLGALPAGPEQGRRTGWQQRREHGRRAGGRAHEARGHGPAADRGRRHAVGYR